MYDVFVHITDKRTPSRPLGEVKLRRARPVVRWVTTCEARVLKALFFISLSYFTYCHWLFGLLDFLNLLQRYSSTILLLMFSTVREKRQTAVNNHTIKVLAITPLPSLLKTPNFIFSQFGLIFE